MSSASGGGENDVTDEEVDSFLEYLANILTSESGGRLGKFVRLIILLGFLYSVGKKVSEEGLSPREAVRELIRESRQAKAKEPDRRVAKRILSLCGLFVLTLKKIKNRLLNQR